MSSGGEALPALTSDPAPPIHVPSGAANYQKEKLKEPLNLPVSSTPFAGAPHQLTTLSQMSNIAETSETRAALLSVMAPADRQRNGGGEVEVAAAPPLVSAPMGTLIGGIMGPSPAEPMSQPHKGAPSQRKFSPLRASGKMATASFTSDSLVPEATVPTPMIDLTAPLEVMSVPTLEVRRSMLLEELDRVDMALEQRRRKQRYELAAREEGIDLLKGGNGGVGGSSGLPGAPVNINTSRHNSPTRRNSSPPHEIYQQQQQQSQRHHQESIIYSSPATPSAGTASAAQLLEATERRRAIASELRSQALSLMSSSTPSKTGERIFSAAALQVGADASSVTGPTGAVASALKKQYPGGANTGRSGSGGRVTPSASPSPYAPHGDNRSVAFATPQQFGGNLGTTTGANSSNGLVNSPRVGAVTGGGASTSVMEELYRLRQQREAVHLE